MRFHGARPWLLVLLILSVSLPALASSDGAKRRGGSRWGANYFPNTVLTTQDGEKVRFFDDLIEGKVVVINFIYTSCPDSCPLETARLADVQRILGERVGEDVFFYSISIDPETDTPPVLRAYAKKFNVGPGWTFLTGDEDEIIELRKKLGLYIDEIQEDGELDHNLNLMIGNQATGRWMKRSPFENPYVLAEQIGGWLHNWKLPDAGANDYASAPELRTPSRGEQLYRTRCEACHSIGEGDVARDLRRVGPDLLGVTDKRDPEWLARWLAEPEVMLAEEDPIAMELFARYQGVTMPDMRLTPVDVEALIAYLKQESRRIQEERFLEARAEAEAKGETKPCCDKHPETGKAVFTAEQAPDDTDSEQRSTTGPIIFSGVLGVALAFLGAAVRWRWSLH